jgi:hypothetical protein
VIHHDVEQCSNEWWELHRGRATASSFDKIIQPKKMLLSASVDDLIAELIAQKLTPMSMVPEGFISKPMLNGIAMEPEARSWYAMERGIDVQRVGFCTTDDGRFGASPDALCDQDGLIEIKSPLAKTHVRYLMDGELPSEYRCQVHGELLVTGRAWADFVSYCPPLPPFIVRVVPDDFTKALADCLEKFWTKYEATLKKITERSTHA